MFEDYRIIEDCCYPRTLIALATALDMRVGELVGGMEEDAVNRP